MITPTTFSAARTALINLTGRDRPILMLARAGGYLFGIVEGSPNSRYVPFSMLPDGDKALMWDDRSDSVAVEAISEITNLISDVFYGNRDDPHQ